MMNFLMEAVVISFAMGGVFGAIVAMLLKSGRQWAGKEALVYNNEDKHHKINRPLKIRK